MGRQPQDTDAMHTVAVRLPAPMIAAIDAYRARLKAENPAFRVERGDAMRALLLKALALVKAPDDQASETPAAPRPARKGAGHAA